jgi:thiol-disulfide isomerase/thioredoxin
VAALVIAAAALAGCGGDASDTASDGTAEGDSGTGAEVAAKDSETPGGDGVAVPSAASSTPGAPGGSPAEPAGTGSIDAVLAVLPQAQALDHDPASVATPTVGGGTFAAAEVSGPVVYWFWAPWCTICRGEAPEVAQVAERYRGEVTFVGVAGLGPVSDMRDFVDETGVGGFEHAVDPDGSVWTGFGVVAQPSYVFVAADGQAVTYPGGLGGEALDKVAGALAAD